MTGMEPEKLNKKEIEKHLQSAVSKLTPNVLDRIDLSTPQDAKVEKAIATGMSRFFQYGRTAGILIAACLCLVLVSGGYYTYENKKIDSVIGIDVNPSFELSVNRKNTVLKIAALNDDAKILLENMDLKGVDLNIAVNAIIGSMVTHGYLNNLDNAILVTVSNDSVSKADAIRTIVVDDIQNLLAEKQISAVVYDQQVVEENEVKQIAKEYGISYGKAYFLKELIAQNSDLTLADMEKLSVLSMEQIAREIAERSYLVAGHSEPIKETTVSTSEETKQVHSSEAPTQTAEETKKASEETGSMPVVPSATAHSQPSTAATEPVPPTTPVSVPSSESVVEEKIKINYTDYENGVVTVYFSSKVKWKNPTVAVTNDSGESFSAKMGDTGSDVCEIDVSGLEGGQKYTFTIGGILLQSGQSTTVKGTFETPVIGNGNADEEELITDRLDHMDLPQTDSSLEE